MLCADADACGVVECDVVAYAPFSSRVSIDAYANYQLPLFDAYDGVVM